MAGLKKMKLLKGENLPGNTAFASILYTENYNVIFPDLQRYRPIISPT
jgi:hypothetical protein